jgi:hypothetical protein
MKPILAMPGRFLDRLRAAPLQASLVLWIALLVVVGIKNLVWPNLHNAYPIFESGARTWLAGEDPYEQFSVLGYRYGPAVTVALAPLAVLPTPLGSLFWIWLNCGLFCFTLWKLIQRGLPGDWTAPHQALFLSLVLLATLRTIWSGQTNLLIFSLVALAALAIQDRRWWGAAFLLAIPVHLKVWPLAAALLLIAHWPRKLVLRFLAAVLAVGAAPLLAGRWGWVWHEYVQWYDLLVGPAQIRHAHYYDVWTLWEVIHKPVPAQAYLFLQLLSGAVILGLCLWQTRRGLSVRRCLLFVLVSWAVWQMTFGLATERATFGLIAPLSSWGLATAFQERRRRLLMTAAYVLMVASTFGVIERAVMDYFPIILAAHPLGSMLFFTWFLDWNQRTADRPAARPLDGWQTMPQADLPLSRNSFAPSCFPSEIC